MTNLTIQDLKNSEALEAFNKWQPANGEEKTVEAFLAAEGRRFADNYNQSEHIQIKAGVIDDMGAAGGIEDEPKAEFELPKEMTPELAKQLDDYLNEQEKQHTFEKISTDQKFNSTFAMYNQLQEGFKVKDDGGLASVAFQLAQCETRMDMFDSLGQGSYADLLKNNMDSIAKELATNQLIFDTLKMDPLSLSEANRQAFIQKNQAKIQDFIDGKGNKIVLSSEVVTATMAMHQRAVSEYGKALEEKYGTPTLGQKVKALDKRLSKRYGKWYNIAKTAGSSLAAGAVFGPAGIAGITAYRTCKKFREYKHEAKVNNISLHQHLKNNPVKILELGLSTGTALFAGGAALGFEDALTAKLITSGLRGVANESFFKSIKSGQYKKAALAFGITGLATGTGLFAHSEAGHDMMQGVYDKVGGFFSKLGIFKSQTTETVSEPPSGLQPTSEPQQVTPVQTVHHVSTPKPAPVSEPTPAPVSEPTPAPEPEPTPAPEPQYNNLQEKLVEAPEDVKPNELRNLFDEGLGESRKFVVDGFNSSDTGIEEMPNSDDIFNSMNTSGVNDAMRYGHSIESPEQAVAEMRYGHGGDTMQGNPYARDPEAWEVGNPMAFEDTMTGYGHGGPYAPPPPPHVVVVREEVHIGNSGNYMGHSGEHIDHHISSTPNITEHTGNIQGAVDDFNPADIAVDDPTPVEDVLNSTPGEVVYTDFNENDGTFNSTVYDNNGNILENREGDVSYDEHGNKVTSYLSYKPDGNDGELSDCFGRTSIIEDGDTHQIVAKTIEDSDGNLIAEGQNFAYDGDKLTGYTMHNLQDNTYDEHNIGYNEAGQNVVESIKKVSADGEFISNEYTYNCVDENGNMEYKHSITDRDGEVSQHIFTRDDGQHQVYVDKGEMKETVTKDNNVVWDKVTYTDGNSICTNYEYDQSGAETSHTVREYDKDNNLLSEHKYNADGQEIKETSVRENVQHNVSHNTTAQSPVAKVEETQDAPAEPTLSEEQSIIQRAEGVKSRLSQRRIGVAAMAAGGAVIAGSAVATGIANKKQSTR